MRRVRIRVPIEIRRRLRLELGQSPAQPVDLGVPLSDSPGNQRQGVLGRRRVVSEERSRRPVVGHIGPGLKVLANRQLWPLPGQLPASAHRYHDYSAQDHGGDEADDDRHTAIVPWPQA